MEPIFRTPSMGLAVAPAVLSVSPYPSMMIMLKASSNRRIASTGIGAAPHTPYRRDDRSSPSWSGVARRIW